MRIQEALFFDRCRWTIYFWCAFYYFSYYLLASRRLKSYCIKMLILETFYIVGKCQKSGYCCRGISIKDSQHFISDKDYFQKFCARFPSFHRFFPVQFKNGRLLFNCRCLSLDNYCLDYDNRPNICRQYPFASFIEVGFIRKGCGFSVAMKKNVPKFFFRGGLALKMKRVKRLNGIDD